MSQIFNTKWFIRLKNEYIPPFIIIVRFYTLYLLKTIDLFNELYFVCSINQASAQFDRSYDWLKYRRDNYLLNPNNSSRHKPPFL